MWKPERRAAADRGRLRYRSGLTDAEWALIAPLIPPAKHGGRERTVDVREVLNGIFYVLSTGCQWTALPKDLPPKSMVYDNFDLWEWDGTLTRIHHELYVAVRARGPRSQSERGHHRQPEGQSGAKNTMLDESPRGYSPTGVPGIWGYRR